MAGIRLAGAQWDNVDGLRNSTGSAEVFRNCSVILLTDAGHSLTSIAGLLGCSPDTVKRVRGLYRRGGIAALTPVSPPGRTSAADADFLAALARAVATDPRTLGYGFATWSAGRLAAHLGRQTGTTFSAAHLRRLLHANGYSVQRPKHTLRGRRDEAAHEKAARRLRGLKKKP
jgi:transposase